MTSSHTTGISTGVWAIAGTSPTSRWIGCGILATEWLGVLRGAGRVTGRGRTAATSATPRSVIHAWWSITPSCLSPSPDPDSNVPVGSTEEQAPLSPLAARRMFDFHYRQCPSGRIAPVHSEEEDLMRFSTRPLASLWASLPIWASLMLPLLAPAAPAAAQPAPADTLVGQRATICSYGVPIDVQVARAEWTKTTPAPRLRVTECGRLPSSM